VSSADGRCVHDKKGPLQRSEELDPRSSSDSGQGSGIGRDGRMWSAWGRLFGREGGEGGGGMAATLGGDRSDAWRVPCLSHGGTIA